MLLCSRSDRDGAGGAAGVGAADRDRGRDFDLVRPLIAVDCPSVSLCVAIDIGNAVTPAGIVPIGSG